MNECSAYVGLDVHEDTIAVVVAGRTGRDYRAINQSTLVPLRTAARESSGCGDLRDRPVFAGIASNGAAFGEARPKPAGRAPTGQPHEGERDDEDTD